MRKAMIALVVAAALGVLSAGMAFGGEVTLKASCFLPKNHPLTVSIYKWIDKVNSELAGEVKIKYVGGPEVIPPFEQIEAVKKAVIDISFPAAAHYAGQFPVGYCLHLSRLMPWEERKSGFYDLLVEEHQKLGVRYLGRWLYGPFYMWLKEPIKTPADLAGKRLRTNPLYDRFYKALKVVGVTINNSEVYTALERGVVDGTSWPIQGPREQDWIRVLKYIIIYPFYEANNCTILMNQKSWEKLPEATRTKLEELTAAFEHDMVAYWKTEIDKEWELVKKAGVIPIEFSDEDAKKYVDLAYSVEWQELEKRIPDLVAKLKEYSGN